jgi:hypothetical protein
LRRIRRLGIAFCGGPFARDNRGPGKTEGALGMADSAYFYDPDGHNIEIRCYET